MAKHTWFKIHKHLTMVVVLMIFCVGINAFVQAQEETLPPAINTDPTQQSPSEREQFVKEIRRVENLNRKYTKEIEDIKVLLAEKDEDFQRRMKQLEDKLSTEPDTKNKQAVVEEQNKQTSKELENKTNEMLSKIGDLDPEDQQFKDELSKAHYNMGNIYFERGEYQRAVVEYYQAVDLTPNDADIHYNLAFVSGEFLGDQETALKHYQWYLYLKPNAEDTSAINEKILQAKLHVRSGINSRIDKDNGNYNLTR
ncbi:MAG: tetratricopeptide repeat protein [Candidatus Omnitrophota bacterium]